VTAPPGTNGNRRARQRPAAAIAAVSAFLDPWHGCANPFRRFDPNGLRHTARTAERHSAPLAHFIPRRFPPLPFQAIRPSSFRVATPFVIPSRFPHRHSGPFPRIVIPSRFPLCHSEPKARNLRCIDAPRSLARAARGLGMTTGGTASGLGMTGGRAGRGLGMRSGALRAIVAMSFRAEGEESPCTDVLRSLARAPRVLGMTGGGAPRGLAMTGGRRCARARDDEWWAPRGLAMTTSRCRAHTQPYSID
jgi:hypothetical protein